MLIQKLGLIIVLALGLAGCAASPRHDGPHDPYEARNRQIHAQNVNIDKKFLRGAGQGASSTIPKPAAVGINNLAANLELPGIMVNNFLQADGEDFVHNGFRFILNTTMGVGGIFDPASSFGLEQREADFGQTLHSWGVPQGAYLVLPVLGPSSERELAGDVVDFFLNPLRYALPTKELGYAFGVRVASKVTERGQFSDTYDSVLHDSADSYAAIRDLYLQNRQFEVTGEINENDYVDPYAEFE